MNEQGKYNGYLIERCRKENIALLSDLFLRARNIRIAPSYFINKNNPAYTGRSYMGIFAFEQSGIPVAFYGQFPCEVIVRGKKYPAVQSGDVVTHPEHQRKGLFTAMGNYAREHAAEHGTAFMFCSPNENSAPGFVRSLGWHLSAHFMKYSWVVSTIPLYRIAGKLRMRRLYSAYVNLIVRLNMLKAEDFLGDTQIAGLSTVVKSSSYYAYKNTYNQNYLIRWRGVKIWFKVNNGLVVGEIETTNNLSPQTLVSKLKSLAFWLGIEVVYFQTPANGVWHSRLSSCFSYTQGLPICFNPMGIPMESDEFVLTAADVDVF